jgi:hypothetical protein
VVRGERRLGLLDRGEYPPRVADEYPAGLGQPEPAAVAFEQRTAGLPVQLGEVLGHRRRRAVQRVGGGGDGAVGRDGLERAEPGEVDHSAMLKHGCRNIR